ncbi:probable asparagine--tRNA ligase, mitochondrial [Topomyia yanbarensis]|uniref:probable asparagine--tRNA ligase, mitochondrial n=1 Tax=Topomyia yanbarensis TaxID=2498891 RepID=UPI00273C7F0C|nr:probable asparagine--tRNA ligase, mitochondrial [Topomyia yanbarensis]
MLKRLSSRLWVSGNVRSMYHLSRVKDISCGKRKDGEQLQMKGWIKSIRRMKDNIFLDMNDGSCSTNIQLVVGKSQLQDVAYGSSVDVCGILARTARNQLELKVDKLQELGNCPLSEGYPFYPKKSYPPDYIRNYLHLRPQTSSISSMLRVRHHASKYFNDYLDREGYLQIHTPIITSNDCEGAGEAFIVKPANDQLLQNIAKNNLPIEERYFDRKAFLTVSGQLHLEAMCHGLGKVYCFGPTFRAENCKSPIHLSEFHMLELEEAFLDSLEELSYRIESLVKFVTKSLLDIVPEDVALVRKLTTPLGIEESFAWLEKPFLRISYKEAIDVLQQNQSRLKGAVLPEHGINKEQELFLVSHYQAPVFVLSWPKAIKSFYMRECRHDANLVDALDFLVPHVGELAGGSIREDNYDKLEAKLPDQESLRWYLELRKFGSVTTGGFGLGLERYLSWVLNVHNVKDVIPFPRWAHNCSM